MSKVIAVSSRRVSIDRSSTGDEATFIRPVGWVQAASMPIRATAAMPRIFEDNLFNVLTP